MKVQKLTQEQAYTAVAKAIPPGTKLISAAAQRWDVVVVVRDCESVSNFHKSITKHLDDLKKKGAILRALSDLYDAICSEDYQEELESAGLSCKVAHSFLFSGATYKVWELKPDNKNRLYFFPLKDGLPNNKKAVFMLMAYHKKDNKTPSEVSEYCEKTIKLILQARGEIEYCEEKNVAKK